MPPDWNETLQRQYEWLLERLGDPAQEARAVGAVDYAMIVRQRQRQHQSRLEAVAVVDRLGAASGNAEDRHFGPVDDRRERRAADAAEIGDREPATLHVVERELAGARLLGRLRE